jgi:pilus assembly protein CpaB
VYVIGAVLPAGTPAEVVLQSAKRELVAATTVPDGAVTDPEVISGLVTTVDLVPGEQLLSARFIDPAKANNSGTIAVPKGMQEVSILLEPQRSAGGQLRAGDTVGVFVSLGTGLTKPPENVTHLTMHKVLVTAVQGTPEEGVEGVEGDAPGVPGEKIMITLARSSADAEKIVYAQEFGTIWLTKEPADAAEEGTRELTLEGIYK